MEASSLDRMLQISPVNYKCQISTVGKNPWIEVALRRLYVIIQIKGVVESSTSMKREAACKPWSPLL